MKPRKITMQAFGPYLKKTTIDFTPLYDHGLFLISGATGCGKTTILDAMSYALYGHASGSLRDVRDMRSIAAPDSLDTRVEFEMELGGALYKFERAMKVRVVNKRSGEKERRTDHEENCYFFDGKSWRLICSGSGVKDKAVELLGFSHEQFSQVVVLPQGEFRKLLTASSREKQNILEKLFGTARWQAFTNLIAQRSKAIETQLSQCAESRQALCASVKCENPDELKTALEVTRREFAAVEAGMKALEEASSKAAALNDAKSVEDKFQKLDEALRAIEKLKAQSREIDKMRDRLEKAEKASGVEAYLNAYEQAQKALETARKNLEAAKTALDAARKEDSAAQKALEKNAGAEEKLKDLAKKITRLESYLDPARQLCEKAAELEEKKKEKAEAQSQIEELSTQIEKLQEKSEYLKARIKDIDEKYVSRLADLVARKEELKARINNLGDLEKKRRNAANLEKKLEQKEAEHKSVLKAFKNAKSALEHLQKAFDADAAYRLSQQLHDGEKCPVCGSTTHPQPARAVSGAPTKEEIDTQKGIVEELEEKEKDALAQSLRVKAEYDAAARQLSEIESVCREYSLTLDEAKAEFEKVTKAHEEAFAQKELQASLKERQKKNDEAVEKARRDFENRKARLDSVNLEISALSALVKQLESTVPEDLRDVETINVQITKLKRDYDNTDKQMKLARTRADEARNALTAAMERLRSAENAKTSAQVNYNLAKEEFEKRLAASGLSAGAEIRSLLMTDKQRQALKKEIESFDREMAVQNDRASTLQKQLEGVRRPDIKALEDAQAEARKKLNLANLKKGSLEEKKKNLESVKAQLEQTAEREEKLRSEFALYNHLYGLLNGDRNPLKTNIQQFVLGIMLDDIVASANAHLSQLSRGRYTLVHSAETSRGGGTKGLDLAVSDAWSGGERSVSTLSGGEMFLASLSLAFGLSDVVQSYSGGIRLDSLFIDEGFGSLDNETLDTAMSALESLRLSGRLIGIISHVSELGERIPAHIKVERLEDGSSEAKVETP